MSNWMKAVLFLLGIAVNQVGDSFGILSLVKL